MKSGWPPTPPNARAGLLTPPGSTRQARSKASRLRTRTGGMASPFSRLMMQAATRSGRFGFRFKVRDELLEFRVLMIGVKLVNLLQLLVVFCLGILFQLFPYEYKPVLAQFLEFFGFGQEFE